jgi:peptidoglycan hydrolase CwlO-like protein
MDNLGNLEDKVMLLVQTIRKHKEEEERLRVEIEGKDRELEAAGQEKESLQRKLDEYRQLAAENEVLRNKQEEARARVEQILKKLETFEKEIGKGGDGQAELIAEDEEE